MLRIQLEDMLTEAETQQLYAGLLASDPAPRRYQSLTLTLRDADQQLAGALLAATAWNWLSIDVLWIEPSLRGRGSGRSMVLEAERIARQRGCTHARLDTFDFQARSFYERLGFRAYAQLDGFPAGHTQFHLAKSLAPASG
jgi:ribosomal protein S18 acetylase RimI-like enzyme